MRAGWNPQRRNRKIGTAASGRGQDNRLVIPEPWWDRRSWLERLVDPVPFRFRIGEAELTLLVEPTRPGFTHVCTPDDVVCLLRLVPPDDLAGIGMVVLRQPTRKQELLCRVWGSIKFYAEIGTYAGTAIFLAAQRRSRSRVWSHSLDPEGANELRRMEELGHQVETTRRKLRFHADLDSLRATQLYHTLPHEVGHHLDPTYLEKTHRDREVFAHRYADEFRRREIQAGRLPFPRIVDGEGMRSPGMRREWFDAPDPAPLSR